MAATKFPARLLGIQIDTAYGTTGSPDWVAVGGLVTLTHSPKSASADTSDFDSAGRSEHMVMERGDEWSLSGFAIVDDSTGEPDVGQAACEALGLGVGRASLGRFKMVLKADDDDSSPADVASYLASIEVTKAGGGHNDAAKWSAKVTVSGEVTPA